MRRLDGVIHVQLDTEVQFARISFGDPVRIDFDDCVDAAKSAAYETVAIRVTARGTIESADCTDCSERRFFVRLDETGQLLELMDEDFEDGARIDIAAEVRGWRSGHPQLTIIDGYSAR